MASHFKGIDALPPKYPEGRREGDEMEWVGGAGGGVVGWEKGREGAAGALVTSKCDAI